MGESKVSGTQNSRCTPVHIEPDEDPLDVRFHRLRSNAELASYLFIRITLSNEIENAALPGAQ
jgi:hypothetical protein